MARGDEAATVSWSVPANNGNVISSYTVTSSPDSLTCNTSSTSCDVEGLTNGVEYTFTVVATNSVGNSQKSAASLAVVPAGAPLAPTGVVVTRGNAQLTVSWAAADGNGDPVTGYTATATPGNATCTTTDATSCVIPGLVNGTSYVVTVTATNSVGTSTSSISSAAVTPATKPSAPTVVKGLSLAIKKLRITISGMQANGAVITKHEYRFKLSTTTKWSAFKSVGVAKSWIVLGWLKGKTYNVQIRVTNSVGATISKTFNIRPTL